MDQLFFLLKKIVGTLLLPVGLVLAVWAFGACLWGLGKKKRWGPRVMFLAGLLLFILSCPPVGWMLLNQLEMQNPEYARPADLIQKGVHDIVVLSGAFSAGRASFWDKLSASTIKRTMEGVRLWKKMPGSRLIIMGGNFYTGEDNPAAAMAAAAMETGVPQNALVLETQSWDTQDQANAVAKILKGRPFALVTSACHMPRSLRLFSDKGLRPIPAPADFHTLDWIFTHSSIIPSLGSLRRSELAIYEYLGLSSLWIKAILD